MVYTINTFGGKWPCSVDLQSSEKDGLFLWNVGYLGMMSFWVGFHQHALAAAKLVASVQKELELLPSTRPQVKDLGLFR